MTTIEGGPIPHPFDARSAIERARAHAVSGAESDTVMRPSAPSVLDLVTSRTLVTVTLAVVSVALVELDAARHPAPMDALDLALRMVAFGAVLRAVVAIVRSIARLRRGRRLRDACVVLLDDALVVLGQGDERAIPRAHVVGVHGGRDRDGEEELLLFLRAPSAPAAIALPAGAHPPAQVAASRIDRWAREHASTSGTAERAQPSRSPADDYDRIAAGRAAAGEVAVPSSLGWLERGPYAAAAFVVVLAERTTALPEGTTLGAPIYALAALCLSLPLGWLALGVARSRPMRGAALVCTPAELLLRDRKGVHRATWDDVADVRVSARKAWTLMSGVAIERVLVIERVSHASLTIDERRLGWSAPGVRALLGAYGSGTMAASETPASQGSAAGGGISGTDATTT